MKSITRTVFILSLISLFTDTASEMLYPIMPMYLKSIGFSVALIGILEGIAEATAGLSKGYFGKRSDISGRRAPFVQLGYALSAFSKPMMAMFIYPVWIFTARTMDRLGKGIRTGARDALLSDEATPESKGRVFGFHRGMDTFGAVLGPLAALVYLYFFPGKYTFLFYAAFIPGMLAVGISFFVNDKHRTPRPDQRQVSLFSFLRYWKESPAAYRKVLAGLLVFALVNSSDIFLLLKIKQSGLDDTATVGVYIFYNLVFALFAFPVGIIADKIGLKRTFIGGLCLFAAVYFGMAMNDNLVVYFILFFAYGIYASATEGISKAWISNIVQKKDTATAIGTYAGFQSICALLASAAAGLLWSLFGAAATFYTTGTITLFVVFYFLTTPFDVRDETKGENT